MNLFDSSLIGVMHVAVSYLLNPVVIALLAMSAWAVIELGILCSERWIAIPKWRATAEIDSLEEIAKLRIERADFITRIAPMLGLMGTLIPLGPGLAALGAGNLSILTTAMTVAFDTTVLGLLVGIIGFVAGRLRRRWYEKVLSEMEQA
ncbi:MAG: MotA/TolQ/ExbB proton channel family protein [Pseudomonadota bacterium]